MRNFRWPVLMHTPQGSKRSNAIQPGLITSGALGFWEVVIDMTRPIYNDMPLVHYSEQDDDRRFHWGKLRPDVAGDIEIAKNAGMLPK